MWKNEALNALLNRQLSYYPEQGGGVALYDLHVARFFTILSMSVNDCKWMVRSDCLVTNKFN